MRSVEIKGKKSEEENHIKMLPEYGEVTPIYAGIEEGMKGVYLGFLSTENTEDEKIMDFFKSRRDSHNRPVSGGHLYARFGEKGYLEFYISLDNSLTWLSEGEDGPSRQAGIGVDKFNIQMPETEANYVRKLLKKKLNNYK